MSNHQQGKRWVFTLWGNDLEDVTRIWDQLPALDTGFTLGEYGGAQVEMCPTTGKYHVQAFAGWPTNKRWNTVAAMVPGCFTECMKGTLGQNKAYCSKSETSISDYKTWGEWPKNLQGKRSDLESAVATMRSTEGTTRQKLRAVAEEHGAAFVKCHKGFVALANMLEDPEAQEEPEWRMWQANLKEELKATPDDRKIIWYCDPKGGVGKSRFVSYYTSVPELNAMVLSGPLRDMRYAYSEQKARIVFFDIARAETEHVSHMYTMAEELKNGRFMNTKYESKMVFFKPPHVIFFANIEPDTTKWSSDRLIYRQFDNAGALPPAFSAASLPIPGGEPPAAGGAGAPGIEIELPLSLFSD